MMGLGPQDYAYAICIVFLAAWHAYKEVKEMRAIRKYKLLGNPERCNEHGEALARLEVRVENIEDDIREIKEMLRD